MYDLCQLSDWLKIRPSDLMELRADGYSAGNCLDFDQACAAFWNMIILPGREARVKGKTPPEEKLGKNQVWRPKYKSDHDILSKRYYPSTSEVQLDPVVQQMSEDELEAIMDTWDPYAEDEPPA